MNEAGPDYVPSGVANTAGNTGALGSGAAGMSNNFASGTPGADDYAKGDFRLPKILIPMIRRTFPELITNEIVGVQPMAGPVGLAFALRYRYSGETLGNGIDGKGAGTGGSGAFGGSIGGGDVVTEVSGKEAGYNYLNTQYTGVSSAALSGTGSSTYNVDKIIKEFQEKIKKFFK